MKPATKLQFFYYYGTEDEYAELDKNWKKERKPEKLRNSKNNGPIKCQPYKMVKHT